MIVVTLRYVRIGLEQAIYDRAKQAAEADRRPLANWLAVTVERALDDNARGPGDNESITIPDR